MGGKGSMLPETRVLELIGMQCLFPGRTDILSSPFWWVWWPEKQLMKLCLWLFFGGLLQKEVEWAVRPKEQLSKRTDHSAPSWDNSSLLCRFLLCQHTRNSIILCNMVQRFGKIKISFLIWGQNLVPSITANRDLLHSSLTSRKLLVKKSIYSAWIMGTGIWLLLTQAWQLHRCYSIQYYFKISIFIPNKMLTF